MHSQKLFRSIPTQVFKNFLFQKDIIYLMYKAKNNDSFISIVLKKILQVDILNYVPCWLNAFLLGLGQACFLGLCIEGL